LVVALLVFSAGCASAGSSHGDPGAVLNWTLSATIEDSEREVCRSGQSAPCVLDHSTPERSVSATFTLHASSKTAERYTGTLIVPFLGRTDPKAQEIKIDLKADGDDVHHTVNDRVTTRPGSYRVQVKLAERGPNQAPGRTHNLVVPVQVK
jgi:hypothetical protein